jgi:hypothetical protein
MIITPNDFINTWAITQGYADAKLQEYIDYYAPEYLAELLGVDLFNELDTALDTPPLPANLLFIYNPFSYQLEYNCGINGVIRSEGIKNMLLCFVYAHYQKEDLGTPTSGGKIKLHSEGGELQTDSYTNTYAVYNRGIKSYKAIQRYIHENKDNYPTYEGVSKQTSWLI